MEIIEDILDEPALRGYHLLPAVQGDLLARLERHDEAKVAFAHTAVICRNARERALMLARANR